MSDSRAPDVHRDVHHAVGQESRARSTSALPAMPGLTAKGAETAYWILIVPNLALFLLPNHLFTLLYQPDGAGQTLESADLLVHPTPWRPGGRGPK